MSSEARRPRGRPRAEQSPASEQEILQAALRAFATHGYEGVSVRTLNRELGVSHSLINAPSLPVTGSAGGSATFGIVFSALAWFSGVARVTSIFAPGG